MEMEACVPVIVVRLTRSRNADGGLVVRLGVPLLDEYLEFLAGRCRPNTVLAVAYDLKVFFTVVGKLPRRVRPVDVLAFMTAQRSGGEGRLQVAGGGWRRGVGADAVAAAVERVGAAPSGLRRLVGRGRGFKDPSTDRCLCLRLAEVFVVQLPTRSSVNVCDRPPQGWPRRVTCAASP